MYQNLHKKILHSIYTHTHTAIAVEMEWVWLRQFNALRNWVLLLSCDYVLKFDWYCQLSGSGSNSLNSQKLPGRFSYGLGMRLQIDLAPAIHQSTFCYQNSISRSLASVVQCSLYLVTDTCRSVTRRCSLLSHPVSSCWMLVVSLSTIPRVNCSAARRPHSIPWLRMLAWWPKNTTPTQTYLLPHQPTYHAHRMHNINVSSSHLIILQLHVFYSCYMRIYPKTCYMQL